LCIYHWNQREINIGFKGGEKEIKTEGTTNKEERSACGTLG